MERRTTKIEIDETTMVEVKQSEGGELHIEVSRRTGHPVHFYLEGEHIATGQGEKEECPSCGPYCCGECGVSSQELPGG
jgi:hypothetical protein